MTGILSDRAQLLNLPVLNSSTPLQQYAISHSYDLLKIP